MRGFLPFILMCLLKMAIIEPVTCDYPEIDCEPDIGLNGTAEVALLRVETWEQWSLSDSFPKWSQPRFLSMTFQNIRRDDGVIRGGFDVQARLYGGQVCLAVRKHFKREWSLTNIVYNASCQRFCLGGFESANVTTWNRSGQQLINNTVPCCQWAWRIDTRIFVHLIHFDNFSRCVTCDGCSEGDSKTTVCDERERDKCFTVRLQEKKWSNATVIKGCSSLLHNVGASLNCDYKCKNDVELFGSHRYRYPHSVCVSCCSGNSCNLLVDESTITTNSAHNVRVHLISVIGLVVMWAFAIG